MPSIYRTPTDREESQGSSFLTEELVVGTIMVKKWFSNESLHVTDAVNLSMLNTNNHSLLHSISAMRLLHFLHAPAIVSSDVNDPHHRAQSRKLSRKRHCDVTFTVFLEFSHDL